MVLQKQVDMFIFSYANQNHDTYKKVLPTKYQMCFDTKMHFGFMDYYITLQKLTLQENWEILTLFISFIAQRE